MADDTEHPGGPPHDPIQAGMEQFQRAALEAIRAGRAMLDAAETVLRDPAAAETVVRTVSDVARTATETVAGFASRGWPGRPAQPGTSPGSDDGPHGTRPGDDGPDTGFERISVD